MYGSEINLAENDSPGTRPAGATVHRIRATVLVAESEKQHRVSIAEMLIRHGYLVAFAANGEEALSRIEKGGIDLLVCAVSMPLMDGLELLRTLRDNQIRLPTVAVASGECEIDELYLKSATLLGAAATYMRPLLPATFLNTLHELLAV
jgi:CheY-like chemotaxis protein